MCSCEESTDTCLGPARGFCILSSLVLAVIIGVVLVTELLYADFENEVCANNITVGDIIRQDGEYIGLVFTKCPSNALLESFTKAASKWSSVITENAIVPSTIGSDGIRAKRACEFLNDDAQVAGNFELDFLLIFVDLTFFDGVGGVLGEAGPCTRDQNGKPVMAGMTFEDADLRALSGNPSLDTLILHEMAHTLGYGLDWPAKNLIQDPIFPSSGGVNVNNFPKYTGSAALQQYRSLTTAAESFVPLEDGRVNGEFKVYDPRTNSNSGRGSIDLHWKQEGFGFELMVARIRTDDTEYPMSVVTIGAIEDLDYVVDYSRAEPFTVKPDEAESVAADDVIELRVIAKSVPQKSISEFN